MIGSIFCLKEDGPITGGWGAYKSVAGQRETSWPFTSMAEDLNSGLPSTIPASVRVRLELEATKLQVQCSKPLGHTVSLTINSNDMKTSRIFQKIK